jgi:hypothetical protein
MMMNKYDIQTKKPDHSKKKEEPTCSRMLMIKLNKPLNFGKLLIRPPRKKPIANERAMTSSMNGPPNIAKKHH